MKTLKFNWAKRVVPPQSARSPYGFKKSNLAELDENGKEVYYYVPDEDMVPHIEQAFQSIENGTSLRDAANWLTVQTNKPISHTNLNKIWFQLVVDPENTFRQERLDNWAKPKTREEKRARKLVRRKAAARTAITNNLKKLDRLEGRTPTPKASTPVTSGTNNNEYSSSFRIDSVLGTDSTVEAQDEILFRPNPGPQTSFLAASEQEVLYGGAAGGGKSFALIVDPMRHFDHPKFSGLLLRRTNDELRELIREAQFLYKRAYPKVKWNAQDKTFTFPSGATMWFSYLERDDDVLRYQGQAFSWIGMDELTQYATPYSWNYMRSRLRTTASDLPLKMRASTNPGGPGHGWVKKMFIDPCPPNTRFAAQDPDTGQTMRFPRGHVREGQPLFYRKFIPARLSDNPYLMEGGQYEASLLSLPENQRRQLLEGDWTVAQGAAFPEFRTSIHTCEPYKLPSEWRRFRACDYGYSSYAAVLWIAINPIEDQLVVYRELYVSGYTGRDLAKEVVRIENEAGENMAYGVLDSSVFHSRGNTGPVISEEMAAEGMRMRPSDRGQGSRIAGRMRLHELLKTREIPNGDNTYSEVPGIVFFNTCRQTIADLQVIPTDPKGGEDIDDRFSSDHTYDALRYGIMTRPKPHTFFNDIRGVKPIGPRVSDSKFGY